VRKGRVYIHQSSVLRILTVVCSLSLSYSIPNLPTFVNKVRYQHNQLEIQHSTPMMVPQYGHSLSVQQPRCFTQHYNLPAQTLDMSRSLSTMFQLLTTLAMTSLPSLSHSLSLACLPYRLPISSRTTDHGCLGHLPMIIHTPEQRGFQWIVTTGPLSWPLVHIQKPLPPPLNQIHQLETLARRQRRL
jgi:hypothetical protein